MQMLKTLYVIGLPDMNDDEHYSYECHPDATAEEIYTAACWLFPEWKRLEIIFDKEGKE